MSIVKVYNDNCDERNGGRGNWPFSQEFKGKKINIEPGKYVEMELGDAVDFLGLYSPVSRDGDGQPEPRSFKRLRIVQEVEQPKPVLPLHKCNACGFEAHSVKELEEHIDQNHLEQLADQEVADARRKKK